MPQSNGQELLKRIEFEFQGKEYYFVLNPEEYTQTEPSRSTITQTLGGGWVDAFGAGLVEISFSGTTGFKNGTGDSSNGFEKFKELRDTIRAVYNDVKLGEQVKDVLKFYNFTDEEYWEVYPERFSLKRSKSRALLYMYDIKLIALKSLSAGKQYRGRIGNIYAPVDTTQAANDGEDKDGKGVVNIANGLQVVSDVINNFVQLRDKAAEGIIKSAANALKSSTDIMPDKLLTLASTAAIVSNNIAELVGGTNGRFSPAVVKSVVVGTNILDTGNIANIQDQGNILVGSDTISYKPQVSRATHTLFKSLQKFDPSNMELDKFKPLIADYLTTSKSKNGTISDTSMISLIANQDEKALDSSILVNMKEESAKIPSLDAKRIKALIIDGMGIYKDIYDFTQGKKQMLDFTEEDVERLSTNVRYITTKLENFEDVPYMTIKELRKMEINLNTIKSQSRLFDSSNIERIDSFNTSQRGYK